MHYPGILYLFKKRWNHNFLKRGKARLLRVDFDDSTFSLYLSTQKGARETANDARVGWLRGRGGGERAEYEGVGAGEARSTIDEKYEKIEGCEQCTSILSPILRREQNFHVNQTKHL